MAALAVAGVGDARLVVAEFAGLFPNATLVPCRAAATFPGWSNPTNAIETPGRMRLAA